MGRARAELYLDMYSPTDFAGSARMIAWRFDQRWSFLADRPRGYDKFHSLRASSRTAYAERDLAKVDASPNLTSGSGCCGAEILRLRSGGHGIARGAADPSQPRAPLNSLVQCGQRVALIGIVMAHAGQSFETGSAAGAGRFIWLIAFTTRKMAKATMRKSISRVMKLP